MVPAGYRLVLNVRGNDFNHGFGDAKKPEDLFAMTGVGPFLHAEPRDRPPEVFGGSNRLHFEAGNEPYLLLPIIPQTRLGVE